MQLERANELGDEAMINMRIAEASRDAAEEQLQFAAQEKVVALVHLAELSALLHNRTDTHEAEVRAQQCLSIVASFAAGMLHAKRWVV
jgi:hypothetical protein